MGDVVVLVGLNLIRWLDTVGLGQDTWTSRYAFTSSSSALLLCFLVSVSQCFSGKVGEECLAKENGGQRRYN